MKKKTVIYDIFSIRKNSIEEIKNLIETGINIESKDSEGRTPLMEAIIQNKYNIVELFIEAGADINIKDDGGWTALHFAAQEVQKTNNLIICKLLVSKGANLNAQDSYGNTPLFVAISSRNNELITFLKENGSDDKIQNNYGVSPKSLLKSIDN